jgi:hypothetical protein
MSTTTTVDKLADTIAEFMRKYTEEVAECVMREVDDAAKGVLETVKKTAPWRYGEYAGGFVKTNKTLKTHGNRKYVIWNKRHYRRVHLLEFGHLRPYGKSPKVPAIPHMRPAYDYFATRMENNIINIIKNGGR